MNQRTTRAYLLAMTYVLADFVREEFSKKFKVPIEDFETLFWKLFDDYIDEKTLNELTWEICDQSKFLMKPYYTKELLRNEHYLWIKIIKNNVIDTEYCNSLYYQKLTMIKQFKKL